jgi:hypothetical protein
MTRESSSASRSGSAPARFSELPSLGARPGLSELPSLGALAGLS